jgi:anti-sigma B factor antagonist
MTALIAAHTRALAAHASIALTGVPGHLIRALRVVGLEQFFPIHATTSDAVTLWDASPH